MNEMGNRHLIKIISPIAITMLNCRWNLESAVVNAAQKLLFQFHLIEVVNNFVVVCLFSTPGNDAVFWKEKSRVTTGTVFSVVLLTFPFGTSGLRANTKKSNSPKLKNKIFALFLNKKNSNCNTTLSCRDSPFYFSVCFERFTQRSVFVWEYMNSYAHKCKRTGKTPTNHIHCICGFAINWSIRACRRCLYINSAFVLIIL